MMGTVPLNHVCQTLCSTLAIPLATLDLLTLCHILSSRWLICRRRGVAVRCASRLVLSKQVAAAESDRAFDAVWKCAF